MHTQRKRKTKKKMHSWRLFSDNLKLAEGARECLQVRSSQQLKTYRSAHANLLWYGKISPFISIITHLVTQMTLSKNKMLMEINSSNKG